MSSRISAPVFPARPPRGLYPLCSAMLIVLSGLVYFPAAVARAQPLKSFHEVPPQRLLLWNARNHLRERMPMDVVRLWLLHNSLAANGFRPDGEEEAHFRSALWVALGDMGYCPDGLPVDEDAAGIWTLAMFNWMLRAYGKDNVPDDESYWETLKAGVYSRPVSLFDVLDAEELKNFSPRKKKCSAELFTMLRLNMSPFRYPNDRYFLGTYLRTLLRHSLLKMDPRNVEGRATIELRLFDLNAELARLFKQRIKEQGDTAAAILRQAGFAEAQIDRYRVRHGKVLREKEEAELFRRALQWPVSVWMSLSPRRRVSLFRDLDNADSDIHERDRLLFGIIDQVIERGLGTELEKWLGFVASNEGKKRLEKHLFDGDRGKQMLALPPESGFREQSVVSLYRGRYYAQRGEYLQALRSFAYAINHSRTSNRSSDVHALALRWFSFILASYETTDDVLEIVRSFVAREDARTVIKTLLWRAALHRDAESFRRVRENMPFRSRMGRLIKNLESILGNQNEDFISLGDTAERPGIRRRQLRFAKDYVERLSLEPIDVRAKHILLLQALKDSLQEKSKELRGSTKKSAGRLSNEIQIQLDALGQLDESIRGQARSSALDWTAYAGSVRLAPADEVPWPFGVPSDRVPSAFRPLRLEPVEWRNENRELVYGWRIQE